jgi:hypothetical protein
MSTAKPMTTAQRQARYVEQNGRLALTPRQARHIRKTALRLEHGRHRKPKTGIGRGGDKVRGRKGSYAHWLGNAYRRWLRAVRRSNPRARLGRYTPGKS